MGKERCLPTWLMNRLMPKWQQQERLRMICMHPSLPNSTCLQPNPWACNAYQSTRSIRAQFSSCTRMALRLCDVVIVTMPPQRLLIAKSLAWFLEIYPAVGRASICSRRIRGVDRHSAAHVKCLYCQSSLDTPLET